MTERIRVGLLFLVTTLVYGNTLPNGFTMDDFLYIFQNPTVTKLSIRGLFEATKYNNVFRPVTFGTLALNWAAQGPEPWGYHLVNLVLHVTVTLLLYLVMKKLLDDLPQGTTVAWVTALLFAVHPIHTEAVASIVGRSELLAAGFLLGAWLFHLHDKLFPALLCFVLALMSKESAITLVPLIVIGDYSQGKFKSLARYCSFATVGILYLGLLWRAQGGRFGQKEFNFQDNPLAQLPASLRILNAIRVAWKYAGLHVFPATLSSDYSYNSILLYSNWRHLLPPACAAILVLALWVWTIRIQRKDWFLAGAIYVVGFAVTANILVPTGTIMGERLAYLPSAGFCLLVALLWIRLEERNRTLAWAALALIVAAFGIRTIVRNTDWRDNLTLFSSAVRAVPGSAKVHAGLGWEFLHRDQLEPALAEFRTSTDIYPDFAEVWDSYGLAEARQGHHQEALLLLQKSLAMTRKDNMNYDYVAVNVAAELINLGKFDDAMRLLNEEIMNSPEYSRAWANRAVVWYHWGKFSSARTDAETALRLEPANEQARNLLVLLNTAESSVSHP